MRIIMVQNDMVLLVRHWYAPGVWTLPGGGVDPWESVYEAAIREAREETGFKVHAIEGTVGTYTGGLGKGTEVTVVYSANIEGPISHSLNFEIMMRAWYRLDNLPLEFDPSHRRFISKYLAGVRNEVARW